MGRDNRGFIPVFRELSEAWAVAHAAARCTWRPLEKREAIEFTALGSNPDGFDISLEVQDYGVYPFVAGTYLGWSWDIVTPGWSAAQMSEQALAFVRALLCVECRVKTKHTGKKQYGLVIEANSPHGWQAVDDLRPRFFRRWLLSRRHDLSERSFQNCVLPPIGLTVGTVTWQSYVFDRHGG